MATAAVCTPVKSHAGIFSTRTAGGRIPLTPSPRSFAATNSPPFTPPSRHHDPEWHAEKINYTNLRESLSAAFTSLKVSTPVSVNALRESTRARFPKIPPSPKSDIAKKASSPARLELGVSKWTLGSSSSSTHLRKIRCEVGKRTIRMNGDRFIPNRSASSPTAVIKTQRVVVPSHSKLSKAYSTSTSSILHGSAFGSDGISTPADGDDDDFLFVAPNAELLSFQSSIAAACNLDLNTRILAFKPKAPELPKLVDLRPQYNRPLRAVKPASQRRQILTAPERVLDAPGLLDDYYLNILDWSSGNQVAIGLEREVYVWNADTGAVSTLMETAADTYVSSVKWSADGAYIAIGTGNGDVQLWDIEEQTKVRVMQSHESRIGVISWNQAILSTGARSGNICNHDVRIAEHKVAELNGHSSEVCGLEWRSDGTQLASGGNDNLVNIWDARLLTTPKWTKTKHRAAVKALAWCPWQTNLLATGGGNYDGCIHFWNSITGARVNSINTESQVTSLKWSTSYRELVSCHGMPDNQLTVWSYPTLTRIIEIPAHESRILYSSLSPDGQVLATCASDENLKFWKLFEKRPISRKFPRKPGSGSSSNMYKQMTIR